MTIERSQIQSFLQNEVVPQANKIDRKPLALKSALTKMGGFSWLAMKAPQELGGSGLNEAEYRPLQIEFARASGALTFLQTQHQSAVGKIAQSKNKSLPKEFFPEVAQGKVLIGVGFSHLRRPGVPMMQASETSTGYLLTGTVPWVTGYGFFDHFILGATLADGRELYGLMPLANQIQKLGGEIICSEPMKLLAASATNTVSVKISKWFLKRDRIISINPQGTIHHSSRRNVLNHGFFALGCAYAGVDLLRKTAAEKQREFLHESWESLSQEVAQTEEKAITLLADASVPYSQRLLLRAKTIDLAQRCSLAAVIASSGAANYSDSSAARVYREALLFSVSGQTKDVMQASLKQLTSEN